MGAQPRRQHGAGYHLGLDETGLRDRRLANRFRAHPNVIKQLRCGEALVVSQRPSPAVRRLLLGRSV